LEEQFLFAQASSLQLNSFHSYTFSVSYYALLYFNTNEATWLELSTMR
jgi:hypothetical protein